MPPKDADKKTTAKDRAKGKKPREKCWTRSAGGKPYTVCENSKGQKGKYKKKEKKGKTDTEKKQEQNDKDIKDRRKVKDKMADKYPDGLPPFVPKTESMKRNLIRDGAKKDGLEKMGKTYVYDRWRSTKEGKKHAKKIKDYDNELVYLPSGIVYGMGLESEGSKKQDSLQGGGYLWGVKRKDWSENVEDRQGGPQGTVRFKNPVKDGRGGWKEK